jgi:hypothetical protein
MAERPKIMAAILNKIKPKLNLKGADGFLFVRLNQPQSIAKGMANKTMKLALMLFVWAALIPIK